MTESKFSAQEEHIMKGLTEDCQISEEAMHNRPRIQRILKTFRQKPPRMAIDRALLFTESYRATEGFPVILRWSKAIRHVLENLPVVIMSEELIVGRAGPAGRYGILYPELRCNWLEQTLSSFDAGNSLPYTLTEDEAEAIRTTLLPYWTGKTLADCQSVLLPDESRRIFYGDEYYSPMFIINETATERHILQWVLDYEKILTQGTDAIKAKAQDRLQSLDPKDTNNGYDKRAFLLSVLEICNGIEAFSRRYAQCARDMAEHCDDFVRRSELLRIASICDHVPMQPARDFWEAVQSQWFIQLAFRLEVFASGGVSQGRIDQYFYPFFRHDKEAGLLDDNRALELLECLWFKLAESMTMRPAFAAPHRQGNSHYEAATIGGLLADGRDGTNELSYLILKSKQNFPLDYPDLSVRIHTLTPNSFLAGIADVVKQGSGFPKLFNDEALIPYYVERGVPTSEARCYNVSGCTEIRLPNRDGYVSGHCALNAGAVLEMTLFRGCLKLKDGERYGIDTGDPREFATFEDFWQAFTEQFRYFFRHVLIQNQVFDSMKSGYMASPLMSMLHDRCFEQCKDIHCGDIEGTVQVGFWEPTGFGTVTDSLCAIKKLVYDDKVFSMDELISALEDNFEHFPVIHQQCLNAPKYGNNDSYADAIGLLLETFYRSLSESYKTLHGGRLEVRYVPVTAHVPSGRIVSATPNGRLSREPLSEGIGPQQGFDISGPTALMLSVSNTQKCLSDLGAARLFNMKLSPQCVNGEAGTAALSTLIRAWCDLKLWHIQFSVVNNSTLRAAQKDPQKYRNLIVRVAGYSAYFVDLSSDLQDEIVKRTEHLF
jgi:formate C-acetyltransferase